MRAEKGGAGRRSERNSNVLVSACCFVVDDERAFSVSYGIGWCVLPSRFRRHAFALQPELWLVLARIPTRDRISAMRRPSSLLLRIISLLCLRQNTAVCVAYVLLLLVGRLM